MSVFDLVFIATFFTAVTFLAMALWAFVRGRYGRALRIAVGMGGFLAVYMGTVVIVSILTPRRVLGMHEDQCFDDWCLAAAQCSLARAIGTGPIAATAHGVFYVVTLRVSSRAGRVAQRAPDAAVYLMDSRGRKYFPSSEGQRAYDGIHGESKPLSTLLEPLESFSTIRVFDLPADAQGVGLVVAHGEVPGWFIIGDSQSLWHKRTVIRLESTDTIEPNRK
jgi:hypothetical protein